MEKNGEDYVRLSRFISKILRHDPDIIGIKIERCGAWANVDELIDGINKTGRHHIDRALLNEIVAKDSKRRYNFNSDGTKIRANQGHSIDVVIEMEKREPPEFLYHGTSVNFLESIMHRGLLPRRRNFVHLSWDYETAVTVGYRHSKPNPPVVLKIHAGRMWADGYEFMISENGVWQIKRVPPQYFELLPRSMIGQRVTVIVDRAMGTYHPEHPDIYYPINYGYVRGFMAGDGEEQDAYILGIDEPLEKFAGRVIAIVHRNDDVEEKWVVAPENTEFTADEIMKQVHFQEQYFNTELIM